MMSQRQQTNPSHRHNLLLLLRDLSKDSSFPPLPYQLKANRCLSFFLFLVA